jgi:hypothetical protein
MGDVVCMGVAEKNCHDGVTMNQILKNQVKKNISRKKSVILTPYFY